MVSFRFGTIEQVITQPLDTIRSIRTQPVNNATIGAMAGYSNEAGNSVFRYVAGYFVESNKLLLIIN
jgi:hypothetical protein